jgi:TP901 family phage tail tape measure protein
MATTINANLRINTSAAYSDIDVFKSRINKSFSQPLGRISGDAAEFSKSLQAAAARVTAFGATTGSIYLVSKAISETARATIEVNKQLTELNTFLGESQSNLNNFSKSLFSIARNTGATFSDATEAAKEFARQGLSTQETLTRTNDALVLSRISGLNYAQSVNSITTALNGFSKEALTSTEIINKLIAVDTRFAVSSRDLSEALTRVGSAAEEAGLSSDQLVATITAAQQITGRGGAVIGNALKTIFTRVRRPEILDQLKQIGVVVNDQNGSLLNAIDILKNYTNVTKNLSQAEKSRTAELLGGVYQINQLQSVIRDLGSANSIYANSLKISIGATDEAIKKNAELNKSYAALITETKTVALQAGADIGKSLFGPLISSGASLTKTILGFLSPESIEPEISKTGQKIGNTLSKEIGRGVLDTLGNALVFVGAPVAAVVAGVIGKRLKNFLSASVKTQIKEVTDPLGRVITGGSYSGEKEKEQINLQNQIADVIKKRNFIGQATVKGVYDEGQARREVLKEILAQNAQLEKQAKLASTIYSTVSKIKPTVTNLSQVNAFGANQAAPRRDSRGRFIASGYIPAFGDAEKEVAMAKGYGAKNPKAQLIQATIKGKTQSVMVNSEEDVIPNFAGTRETAIIPRYRNVKDIPRMGSGYVPNFSSTSGSFGSVSRINESQVRKTFFSGAGQSGAGEIANEFLASRKLSEQIQASRELGYQGMRGGYIGKLFQAPNTYGTLEESIRSGSIVKSLAPGKTAKEIGDNLDKYTGEYKNYYELVTNLGRLSAKQINSGKTMEARDLANFGNLMLNKKAEDLITKIVARKGGERLVGKMNSSWQTTSRVAEALARQGARISIVDPGIFGGLDKKRKKELGKLGFEDNYREMTGVNAAGYIPNFAKKDKYKFPSISSAKMEANIGRNFEKLSPGDQKYFARAYEDYNNLINVFSKASGTSPEKFANVMSALSPANPLERNALDALRYNLFTKKKLSTIASPIFLDEREIASVKAQTYGANRSKAANLLVGLEKLTGNKRKAFLNNMLDPFGSQDVTVDYRAQGDALNKKFNVKNAPTMNREQYDKVSQAFRNVGSRAGVSGLGVQAATWIGGRMGSKAARGQDFNRGILKFFYDNPDKISLENLEFLLNVPGKGKARSDFFKKASAMGVSKLGSDSLISISRAGGYIPNFSGLSDSISREKTMTGLPVSQIMAHFDKSGNPIAVTNKKDEPNGLKDVVPNFAPRVRVPKGAKGPKGATAAEASDLFGSFVNNFIYGGLFQSVLSTLADREIISGTINSAVQIGLPAAIAAFQTVKSLGASKGQKPGVRALAAGIPVALGAAQAGLGFFSSESVGEDLQRRKLEKESDRAAKEFKDLTEGTQELSDTLSKLNEAFKDATTSPEQLSNLSKRTSELTRNITKNNPALAASISSEPNIERKINLIEDARRNASQKQAVQQEIIQFKGLTKRSPEDLINLFSKQISLANDKLLQVSKQDLIPQNLDKILAEADLQPLADFFKLQKEEVKNKLVPAFIEAVKSEIDYNKINKENIKKIKSLRSEEIKARNEIEGQRVRRQASSEALRAGAEELKPFAGQFGARAAISFDADLQKTKESITAITSFRNQVNTKLIDKELKLPSNVVDRLKGIETPGQEAGAVLSELSKTSNLNEKQKEALDELIAANTNQSKELQKIADISEINKNAQLRVLTIQEKLNYGGGIKTTTDARSRIDSINAPIKGLLENRLGTMLGSERSQTSGMVNVLKSIKDLYPGLIENSKALGGVRDRLTNLRAGDLQKDLLRNASLLQSAGGYGDLPGLLRAKAFDSEGLKNLAATQAEAELSGGGTPQEGARYLADVIKDAVSSLNQRMVDDQTIKNLEEQTRLPVQKINEETEAARQKFLNSLTESVKTAFGENIQVQTVNIPNANVNINPSSAYQPGESSGAAQARASMTTMASGASGPRSKGFIPSFYNPLREAIQRESQYVPFNSIRVNKSNKLVNQNNPLGLAVTNTIDEPNGLASIGLASKGYVPNFASKSKVLDKVLKNETLYGSKISKEAQRLAKKGQLWGLDYAASDPAKGDYILYKIKPNGSLGERGMPNKGDTVLSHVAASKFLGGVKDLLPISKLAEPPKSQEASLAGGTILPTSSIDKIIRDVKKKGGSATDLQKAVETFAQQNLSTSNFLIKTGVGNLSIQSKGVFGINSKPLDSSAYGTILNDYGRGKGKSSDFFIQEKAQLSGQHNESRVHVAIDGKGNAKLVRNGTIDKSTGGNLAKGSYRRAAERAALQAAEAFVKANPKLAKNQFLGLDVGAVAATEGKRLGLTTRSFSELGQKFNPIVFEINPTNRRGSQGGSGFVSAENPFSKATPSDYSSILSRLGVKADNKLVQSNVLEALSKGVMGNDTLLGSVKNKIADTNIPFPSSFFGKVKGAFSSSSSKVKSLFQNAGAKISNLGNSVFGSVGSKFSGVTDKIGAGLSGSSGRAKGGLTGGLAALGVFGNAQQGAEDLRAGRNLEASLSFLATASAAPGLSSGLVDLTFGKSKVPTLIDKASSRGLQAASAFSTAAESAREFREGNYGLGAAKGAEAAAYAASIFGKTGGAKAFGIGSALGLGAEIAKAKNNAIAEDYSDILFGKKDEYIDPETGEVTKSRSILGAGFDLYGTAMGAIAGGPVGQGVAVFKAGYRAGNVIENKLGIGEKLGKIYEDKINKERAGEIAGAEARLKAKKEGFKDREAFAANIAKIEAETEKAKQEIRSKGRKDISEVYSRAQADKEKNDKDRTSFLRKRIVGDIIKNEEANGLSTSKDRANYLMSQEAIYGKFKPEEFADKELYKSYKAYSKEKETTQAREQKFNSAVMNPEMAGSQTYRVDQFRAEAERQSAMLASVPKDALEEAIRRGVSVEQVMEERRKVNKSRGFVPNFSNAYNREKLDILRNPDYSGYRNAVPQPSKYYKNIVKNSAEIEVPAVEVYNRMGYFGATPKNPSEQYAILNPAQQAKLGYASGGFVPNFAAEQFAGAVSDAMQKALSPLIDKVGTSVSNSNVINVSDQRSYQTSTDQITGIMEFLYSQFPKEMGRQMGPKLV